ncbi:MAG: elongation factor 4, partial [Spirochaetia bacterium]|nr:elongation factor 4 [Spirochaetia bacterium]
TIEKMEEPYVQATILTPPDYMGNILALLQEKRGVQESILYLADGKVQLVYTVPLAELIFEFYDRLKSCSRGYASLDYEVSDYQQSDLVKVDILVNGEPVDALAMIVHKTRADSRGRALVERLKELIPRQQFLIPLQAAMGSKVIARETISALKKNVTAKCYGGDITRKKKLLEKQKEGKKRMKQIGSVDIPQEAFLALLKTGENN